MSTQFILEKAINQVYPTINDDVVILKLRFRTGSHSIALCQFLELPWADLTKNPNAKYPDFAVRNDYYFPQRKS